MTGDLYNLNILVKLRGLLYQILINLAIAETILQPIAEQVPFLHRIAPGYLRLITACSIWPFMPVSALTSLVLLIMIVLFSVPSSIP